MASETPSGRSTRRPTDPGFLGLENGCRWLDSRNFEGFEGTEGFSPRGVRLLFSSAFLYWSAEHEVIKVATPHIDCAVPEHRAARPGIHSRASSREIRAVVHRAFSVRGGAPNR